MTWSNQSPFVESQLAYEYWNDETTGAFHFRQLWGHEVTIALEERRIKSDDVFRWLKPALYNDKAGWAYQAQIEDQIRKLPEQIQMSHHQQSAPNTVRKLTPLSLFSDYLGHVWRFVLRRIKEFNPELPWPEPGNVAEYRSFDPTSATPLDVVISVPADSKPHHVRKIIDAAKAVRIPTPHPVAEPAAAFACHIQNQVETHGCISNPSCSIILDIGGGSVDIQAYSVIGTKPLMVREEIDGSDGWCGGSRVNATFRMLLQHQCRLDFPDILQQLSNSGRTMTQEQFLDEAEQRFEFKKRDWNQERGLLLSFSRLPATPSAGLRQDCIHLPEETVRKAFKSSLDPILILIDTTCRKYHDKYPLNDGTDNSRICEILLVGGGSACTYVKEELRKVYAAGKSQDAPYPIAVRVSGDHGSGSTTSIVKGALLLMLDRAFVAERVIRRGYCVGLDEPCMQGDRRDPQYKVLRDPFEGIDVRIDVTRFLIRIGERIGHEHRAIGPQGCWRGLFLDEKGPHGWTLEENIYHSDTCSQDSIWINDPKRDDIKQCGILKVVLSEEDCKGFEVRVSPIRGRHFLYLEYFVELVIKGIEMTYQIVIPMSGRLSGVGEVGADAIRKEAQLDCAGDFELFNVVRYS